MSLYIVDIHGDIEGDYEIIRKYEEQESCCEQIFLHDFNGVFTETAKQESEK